MAKIAVSYTCRNGYTKYRTLICNEEIAEQWEGLLAVGFDLVISEEIGRTAIVEMTLNGVTHSWHACSMADMQPVALMLIAEAFNQYVYPELL